MILELPGSRKVDLRDVKGMPDDEYEGLLYYAKQWDHPDQAAWVADIEHARTGKLPTESPNETQDIEEAPVAVVPDTPDIASMTASEVVEWVGDSKARASEALDVVQAKTKPPVRLVAKLKAMLDS